MDIPLDKKTFQRHVDVFVEHHRKKQEELIKSKKRRNENLEQVIANSPPLPDNAVEVCFEQNGQFQVPAMVVEDVHRILKDMQNEINYMSPRKRFFILETANFFSSQIGIGKLIPALLILKGEDQKKAICEFVLPSFLNINKNVETLVADDTLFDKKSLHVDRGGLYTFVSDLAKTLIKLFKDDFILRFGDMSSPIEFFLSAFDPTSFRINSTVECDSEYIYQEITDEDGLIRKIVLDFIVQLQSHDALYNYSLKRHRYYKSFLMNLTGDDRFEGIDPIDISKILAGCMLGNDQFQPSDELVESLIDEETYLSSSTIQAKKEFINELSPSTVFKLIVRMKASLQHISRSDFGDEFHEVQKMSIKTILKTTWIGFIRFLEKGLAFATEPIIRVVDQIKSTYEDFIREERQQEEEEEAENEIVKKSTLSYKPGQTIPKNLESFAIMTQHFTIVEPDIIGFRGEHEGANHKDFGFNIRAFRLDEKLTLNVFGVFQRLFETLKKNKKVRTITFENQRKIQEYAVAYSFSNYMICLGISHLRTSQSIMINEKDLFPYLLLFAESKDKKFGRVLSREVADGGKVKIYNSVAFSEKSTFLFYEALYLIFHLLPEKDWKSKETQMCIDFLVKELNEIKRKKKKLLYCVNLPTLSQ